MLIGFIIGAICGVIGTLIGIFAPDIFDKLLDDWSDFK